ncbi:MAG: cysteine-rich VLP domain-containing protein [Eubacteriales bacterium]|nr:cysteine-rich VLP domain-containing protein [Eubacteriales bacterium]
MSLKITQGQHRRITKLIKRQCCNYDDAYCIALDDGEPCHCIQEISECGIYCNYFKKAVLPADKKLYAEIIRNNQKNI